jgi:hypothetical protein
MYVYAYIERYNYEKNNILHCVTLLIVAKVELTYCVGVCVLSLKNVIS